MGYRERKKNINQQVTWWSISEKDYPFIENNPKLMYITITQQLDQLVAVLFPLPARQGSVSTASRHQICELAVLPWCILPPAFAVPGMPAAAAVIPVPLTTMPIHWSFSIHSFSLLVWGFSVTFEAVTCFAASTYWLLCKHCFEDGEKPMSSLEASWFFWPTRQIVQSCQVGICESFQLVEMSLWIALRSFPCCNVWLSIMFKYN